jgi:nitrite reductase/ring-hydroxylating ferredoxin subunit
MLRLIVTRAVTGQTIIDSVGPEAVVKMLADKYKALENYCVHITYP